MVLALNQERAIKAARRLAESLPVRTHKLVVPEDYETQNQPQPCTIDGERYESLRHAKQALGMSLERLYRLIDLGDGSSHQHRPRKL